MCICNYGVFVREHVFLPELGMLLVMLKLLVQDALHSLVTFLSVCVRFDGCVLAVVVIIILIASSPGT